MFFFFFIFHCFYLFYKYKDFKSEGRKPTFISSVSPYPEEEYYLGKSSWSAAASDWDQRFEVGDVIADPSGSWEPGTAEQYIDQQVSTVTTDITNEAIARQNGDRNLSAQLSSEMATRADQDANLNALINAGIREGGGVQFDTVPTQNSANGITSGGMYSTLKDPNIGFVDKTPKKNSTNIVNSNGVFNNMGALDVSELNATENPHTLTKYASLSAALSSIPTDYQKGGMTIKYVQTSDNKYVQYRLTSQNFSTLLSDWVNDEYELYTLAIPGKHSNNEIVFTSDDVNIGDVVRYNFDVQTQIGYIGLFNSSDEEIEAYGKSSSSTAFGVFDGEFIIPQGFSYAKIDAQGNKNYFDIIELKIKTPYINKLALESHEIGGFLVDSGNYATNTILFRSTDVEVGDTINYKLDVQTQLGSIRLYNSSDEIIGDYGKDSSGSAFGIYKGAFIIPEEFSYAKVYAAGNKSSYNVEYLVDFTLCNSQIDALNARVDNITELYKAIGVLAERGNYATGTILFDANDVSIGDTINYELNVQTQLGMIELYNSSDELIADYGKNNSGTAFGIYKGDFVIPSGFSYAKVRATGNKSYFDVEYLVDFTLCDSKIKAVNTRVDNIESAQAKVKGNQDDFIKRMGYLCYKETYNVNNNLFTSDDVSVGSLLRYDLYAYSSVGLGYVGFYDAGNNEIGSFGKTASGASGQDYTGIFEVPIGFSYAKVTGSDKVTVTISCNGFEQKQDIENGKRVMLKDRLTTYYASGKYYVSFSSGVVFNGKEVHVSRVSQSHYSDYEDGVFVFQEITESGEVRNIYPDLDYANLTGYVRDPNIVVVGNYLVLTTAMANAQRETVANYLFILDSDYNVVYSTEMGMDGYTFGNTLLTPEGKLLKCTYTETDPAVIKIYRSNEVFNTTGLTFTLVNTISHENTSLYEPTIGYVKDKLVLVVRTSSLSTGLICASAGLEGDEEFGAWNELGVNLHAATIEPYNDDYKVLIAGGEFGASYKRPPVVIKWDVENSVLLTKGVVDKDMTVSGSYPSFVNVGGDTYAMVYYEDYNNTAVYTYLYYRRVNMKYLFNH